MKLYEIAQDYEDFIAAVEAGEIPEECIADTLESIMGVFEDKADSIACLIKNLTAEAAAIRAEEINLAERRKAKERQVERITAYLSDMLTRVGVQKVETNRNKITFRKSSSVFIADEAEFIEWAKIHRDDLLTYKEPTINKTAIKKAITGGDAINGARIEDKQNINIK